MATPNIQINMTQEEALAILMEVALENCTLPFVDRHADREVERAFGALGIYIMASYGNEPVPSLVTNALKMNFSQAAQHYIDHYAKRYPPG